MAAGARIGYLINILAKNHRDRGWRDTTWSATLDNGATVVYKFSPTDMKDAGEDAVIIIGKVDVEIKPVISEAMRRKSIRTISESTKVTLTISQLRRLVNESISESRREKSYSERLNDALDVMLSRQLEEYEERCDEEDPKSDFDKLCIALDILTDEQIEELYD